MNIGSAWLRIAEREAAYYYHPGDDAPSRSEAQEELYEDLFEPDPDIDPEDFTC